MIITLLQDNTVFAKYDDGTAETINSTHIRKAKNGLTKAIAKAFKYKGAMAFTDDYVAPTFVCTPEACYTNDVDEKFDDIISNYDDGRFGEIVTLLEEKDTPDHPKMVKKMVPELVEKDGKAVMAMVEKSVPEVVELPVEDEDGNPVMVRGKQAVLRKTVMVKGRKVSKAKRDRLAELLAKDL